MDELTGLPGHNDVAAPLNESLDAMGAPWIAAIFLDIDAFRAVNDKRGHVAGDAMLVEIAAWLLRHADELHGHAFRVGGDEFLLLLPGKSIEDATRIANMLVSTCASLHVTFSAVVFPLDRDMPPQLASMLDGFAHSLWLAEVARGRKHSNVVVSA